ncbi:hypothetical protein LTR50_003829 [Elasticomyces elasticus]|nr:hypothetical protein LTR50_003829 [Elasticomyces elasticus]
MPSFSLNTARPSQTTATSNASTTALQPQVFDILPPLHALLSRLEPSLSTYPQDPTQPTQSLAYKDIPTEVQTIKIKVRRALAALKALPDMERSLHEQDEEIAQLEEKITGQREVLARVGRRAEDAERSLGAMGREGSANMKTKPVGSGSSSQAAIANESSKADRYDNRLVLRSTWLHLSSRRNALRYQSSYFS